MASDIYEKLREQMDQYSVGFPKTETGVEIRILKRLYTPEQAEMFLDLSMLLEDAASVSARTGRDLKETEEMLAEMASQGLIFRLNRGNAPKYGAVPFVVGSYEFQLANIDREFAEMADEYFQEIFLHGISRKTLPMRTVPVNKSIDASLPVAPYEDARKILAEQKKVAVAECICRTQQKLLDRECDKPLEVCFVFGSHAEYFVDNKMARYIDLDEANKILDIAEEGGLVNQPFNVTNPGGMCNCCGCCCGVLRSLKKQPKPAEMVLTNYFAAVDEDSCTACELCADRCQMDAITYDDDVAAVNRDKCIGCGLCVTDCPEEAIRLMPVDEKDRRTPAAGVQELMMQIAEERGTSLIPLKMQK